MTRISLCICTYNRSGSLRETLNSIVSLRHLEMLIEVLIVDNNSTDATAEVVAAFVPDLPIRRVLEPSQGLSHARNRAVAEFKGNVLLFTDDDVRLDPSWLSAYFEAIAEFSGASFFGGRILPEWDARQPNWLQDQCLELIDGVLVWYDRGDLTRYFTADETLPLGASFAARRELLEAIGEFNPGLGCSGTSPGRGEETEFFLRAVAAGARGAYVGKAVCWHKVDERRLTLPSLYRYGIETGRAHKLITGGNRSGALYRVPLHLARGFAQLLKGRGDRFRQCVINAGIEVGMRRASPAKSVAR